MSGLDRYERQVRYVGIEQTVDDLIERTFYVTEQTGFNVSALKTVINDDPELHEEYGTAIEQAHYLIAHALIQLKAIRDDEAVEPFFDTHYLDPHEYRHIRTSTTHTS